jgi:hypothetical protein
MAYVYKNIYELVYSRIAEVRKKKRYDYLIQKRLILYPITS